MFSINSHLRVSPNNLICCIHCSAKQLSNVHLTPHKLIRPPELLFTWGVYFSGLIPLAPLALAKCRANCLVFQLNGEHFTSPAMISEQGLHAQLRLHYQRYVGEQIDTIDRPVAAEDSGAGDINSPPVSRSSSPVLRMSTMRYAQLACKPTELRRSYNLDNLLLLQRRQRNQRKKLADVAEVSREIARLSVRCVTRNELRLKPRTTSLSHGSSYGSQGSQNYQQHHSMGRTLSVLLAEQQEIAPLTLYTAQQLMQQIEGLRCKQRLLQTERETFKERNLRQQQRLQSLRERREELQIKLHNQRLQLEKERIELRQQMTQQQTDREEKSQITRQVS